MYNILVYNSTSFVFRVCSFEILLHASNIFIRAVRIKNNVTLLTCNIYIINVYVTGFSLYAF